MTTQTQIRAKHTPGPWSLGETYGDEIRAGNRSIGEVHGGRFVSNGMSEEYEIPAEVQANARLIAAAPDMFLALCKLVCPACNHELQHHLYKEGCEVERGDGYRHAEFEEALGPCGCDDNDLHDDYPDFLRALNAIRRAKVTA